MGMKRLFRLPSLGLPMATALVLALTGFAGSAIAQDGEAAQKEGSKLSKEAKQGRDLAFDRQKGNCLACHKIPGGELPGDIGPSLVGVADRLDEKTMRAMIVNPEKEVDPSVSMPPFGKHNIMTDEEIDKVVTFLQTLHYE
jgi:sulfur-oxidizing protein SoxX